VWRLSHEVNTTHIPITWSDNFTDLCGCGERKVQFVKLKAACCRQTYINHINPPFVTTPNKHLAVTLSRSVTSNLSSLLFESRISTVNVSSTFIHQLKKMVMLSVPSSPSTTTSLYTVTGRKTSSGMTKIWIGFLLQRFSNSIRMIKMWSWAFQRNSNRSKPSGRAFVSFKL